MTPDEMRKLSIETSMVSLQNLSFAGHSGLVTLKLERGVVRRVWAGTPEGLCLWADGKTLFHVLGNVAPPLVHG